MSWWDDNYTRSDFRSWLTNEGSFFMVNDRLFKEVGEFDEKFVPAYGEDVDMQYRLELAGKKHTCVWSARFVHCGEEHQEDKFI